MNMFLVAIERWRKIMWTQMFALKAVFFIIIAVAVMMHGHPNIPSENLWAFGATYALTGVVLILFGMLQDARENAQRPQHVEVLLRHNNKAWRLTVMRSATGELYAPLDESKRVMKPVDLREVSEDVLGCPKFTPGNWDGTFWILGKQYTTL
jgi:hypothetical protein